MSPSGMWISVEGAAAIEAALKDVGNKASIILEQATLAGAEQIRAEAARLAPRDTGQLAGNIETKTTDKSRTKVNVAIGPDVAKASRKSRRSFYGLFLEFGTQAHALKPEKAQALKIGDEFRAAAEHPGLRARPFMRPALDTKQDEAQEKIAEILKRELGL